MRRIVSIIVMMTIMAGALIACSTSTAYANQCVFITGGGTNDAARIKDVLYPGEKVNKNDDEDWYVPCNSRNYIITQAQDSGDYHSPITGLKTAKDEAADQAGAKFNITGISMFWALNQKEAVLREFFPFCQKYACYNTGASDDQDQEGTNFSSPGWNGMLRENFPYAIERATKRAALEFPPSLPEDSSLWPAFADKVSEYWMLEMGEATGWNKDDPWFCGSGGDLKQNCAPVRFTIESMAYADSSLQGETEAQAQQERQLRDLERQHRLDEAKHQEALRAAERKAELEAAQAARESNLWNTPGYREQQQWAHEERMMKACTSAAACYVGSDGRVRDN